MTYGHAWEYGQTHVECEDFDNGERISVEIPRGIETEMAMIVPRVYRSRLTGRRNEVEIAQFPLLFPGEGGGSAGA